MRQAPINPRSICHGRPSCPPGPAARMRAALRSRSGARRIYRDSLDRARAGRRGVPAVVLSRCEPRACRCRAAGRGHELQECARRPAARRGEGGAAEARRRMGPRRIVPRVRPRCRGARWPLRDRRRRRNVGRGYAGGRYGLAPCRGPAVGPRARGRRSVAMDRERRVRIDAGRGRVRAGPGAMSVPTCAAASPTRARGS